MTPKRISYWLQTARPITSDTMANSLTTDVLIIGAGITGLTAAYLLKKAGLKVIVIDQKQIACAESGYTTAHLTEYIDSRYAHLAKVFGSNALHDAASSTKFALEAISNIIQELNIKCQFERTPLFLFASSRKQLPLLQKEVLAARDLGWHLSIKRESLPIPSHGWLRIDNQAQFHPQHYLAALVKAIVGRGNSIFSNTRALKITESKAGCLVETERGTIISKSTIIASHAPFGEVSSLITKVAAYRTYAIAFSTDESYRLLPGLFWDLDSPYHYIRLYKGLVIIGGEDHKTGNGDATLAYNKLQNYAYQHFPVKRIIATWSGQILQSVDGLPFIGRKPSTEKVYVATGFNGNGMTFGTLAGYMLSEMILGRENRWAYLYDPSRSTVSSGISTICNYFQENKDYPLNYVKDRLTWHKNISLTPLQKGEGKIVRINEELVAVSKDTHGKIHALSPICSHMGCYVHWNNAESSWDCPCHGSRFDMEGKVLTGPVLHNLRRFRFQ